MPEILRAQVAFGADTAFPRDRIAITPHFNDSASGNAQTLADDLATKFSTYTTNNREIVVKVYRATQPKPNPPLAIATRNAGLTPASPGNREVALCLSYYATNNVKRRRGRLYIPAFFLTTGALGVRPTSTQRTDLGQIVTILQDSGPASIKWCVYSRKDAAAYNVTDWWADDEWDSQRRRGLRPTTRSTGTTTG
jgi:hypothetical protein